MHISAMIMCFLQLGKAWKCGFRDPAAPLKPILFLFISYWFRWFPALAPPGKFLGSGFASRTYAFPMILLSISMISGSGASWDRFRDLAAPLKPILFLFVSYWFRWFSALAPPGIDSGIWVRLSNLSFSYSFLIDFDDFRLWRLLG